MMNVRQNRHFRMRHETIRDHKCLSWTQRQGFEGWQEGLGRLECFFGLFCNRPH